MTDIIKMDAQNYFFTNSGIVTLCGSTKFFFETVEANRVLTFLNWIVLQSGSYGHSMHKFAREEVRDYKVVKKLHFHKIQMSDCILIVTDSSRYIGDSTKAEIAFAQYLCKPVFWFVDGIFTGSDYVPFTPVKREKNVKIEEFLENYNGGNWY
jgi:hypothetical protein